MESISLTFNLSSDLKIFFNDLSDLSLKNASAFLIFSNFLFDNCQDSPRLDKSSLCQFLIQLHWRRNWYKSWIWILNAELNLNLECNTQNILFILNCILIRLNKDIIKMNNCLIIPFNSFNLSDVSFSNICNISPILNWIACCAAFGSWGWFKSWFDTQSQKFAFYFFNMFIWNTISTSWMATC